MTKMTNTQRIESLETQVSAINDNMSKLLDIVTKSAQAQDKAQEPKPVKRTTAKKTTPKAIKEYSSDKYTVTNMTILEDTGKSQLVLSLMSWNGGEFKYDIRTWYPQDNGTFKPGKGARLSRNAMTALRTAVNG